MHPFFEPLDERETMLLLTALTVGGSSGTEAFACLPAEPRARLEEKAKALLEIPAEKRVPFMVHEIKRALSSKGLRGVERVDPSWILQALRGESPRVVAAVLIMLPASTVRSVIKRLPAGIRKALPPKEEMRRIPMELLLSVRRIFESRFHAMPVASTSRFAFRDIIQLERLDIYSLMRDLGLVELGQAFVAVGKLALAELCRRLPREKAEELILAVRGASRVDLPDLKSAQRFLSRVVMNFDDTEEFFQKAGLWRLAKASLLEDPAFRSAFGQRMPRQAGQLFLVYIEKAGEMEGLTPGSLRRLQNGVLLRVQHLAQKGRVSPRWAQVQIVLHPEEPEQEEASPL